MSQAYLDVPISGSTLRALLGVAAGPQTGPAVSRVRLVSGATLPDDLRFFAGSYLLGLVFFLLLLV